MSANCIIISILAHVDTTSGHRAARDRGVLLLLLLLVMVGQVRMVGFVMSVVVRPVTANLHFISSTIIPRCDIRHS